MNHAAIHSIRDFNRFYTAILGVVNNHILESEYSLTEARIIYELSVSRNLTARAIKETLGLDEGYMSRIIAQFVKKGIVRKEQLPVDKRAYTLQLTGKGKKIARMINYQSDVQVARLIEHLSDAEQEKLVHLMLQIKHLLRKK